MKNEIGQNYICLSDGTCIEFEHCQNNYERVYADLTSLEDTGFENDLSIKGENLKIKFVKGYGIRLNEYGIACYSDEGYYVADISITATKNKKLLYEKVFDANDYKKKGNK